MAITRRGFFGTSLAAGALAGVRVADAHAKDAFEEPAREIPVDSWADVIVVGGGPAATSGAM